ncbi:MAG: HAMP domain-containing histidine kinase [Acidobacteriota bacterium]|nr:HAMP domain-containing histidine kinase [Acidobacteriota bacterium]
MKKSWLTILVAIGLFGLLVLLATLQYQWLGQISQAERERLERNLQTDTQRFAEDFNREMQSAYFNFQLDDTVWRKQYWAAFNERYDFWRQKTAYPNLITDFYFVPNENEANPLRYNTEKRVFEPTSWNTELTKSWQNLSDDKTFEAIDQTIPALLMPIYENSQDRQIIIKTDEHNDMPPMISRQKYGLLIIKFDRTIIGNQIFPDLVKKYFSESESAKYKLAVVGEDNQTIFQTQQLDASDASAKIFNLSPENFVFFADKDVLSSVEGQRKKMVFSRFEKKSVSNIAAQDENQKVEIKVSGNERRRVSIFEGKNFPNDGIWVLNVQHEDGSLAQYVGRTRNKNLAVSFGILSLLAASVVMIFISSNRARRFAQRQIDFVSAVSHEFRTPLAVIYSAGENLSDGVIREESKITNYGKLIKSEGRKLSNMVEQILEFAGANSGRRKYDMRQIDVQEIIDNALCQCQPLLQEKGFTLEKIIAKNLPKISADKQALSHAIQNLIVNAVKYGNGEKWLKISAENGDGQVKIAVEDKGIGISSKDLKHIFEPFYRSKKVIDEQIHGNGLGLSLVEQTVEAHGGKIAVESEIGKGSRFTIELAQKKI